VYAELVEQGGLVVNSGLCRRNNYFFHIPTVVVRPEGKISKIRDNHVVEN